MGMARDRNPTVRERRVEKLSMAALLASEYPALLMEPLENLTNFHSATVPGSTGWVNAVMQNNAGQRRADHGSQHNNHTQSARPLRQPG